jgi:hypothetical protein
MEGLEPSIREADWLLQTGLTGVTSWNIAAVGTAIPGFFWHAEFLKAVVDVVLTDYRTICCQSVSLPLCDACMTLF